MSTPTQPQPAQSDDLGALLSRSFDLFFARIGQYVVISLIVAVPIVVVSFLLVVVMAIGAPSVESPIGVAAFAGIGTGGALLLSILGTVGGALMFGAVIHAAKTQIAGGETSVGEAYKAALSKWLPLVAVTIVVGLAVSVGSLLFLLPGLAALFFLCLTPIALMVDDLGVGQALSRSCSLALKVPGEIIVIGLIAVAAAVVLGLIPILGLFANCVVMPWALIALTLAYEKAKRMAAST
jgi:hypothetical protein